MYVSTSGEYLRMSLLSLFSLATTRSTTCSMVRACSVAWGTAAAALFPHPLDTSARIPVTTYLRIVALPSVGQAEFDPHAGRKIHCFTLSLRRFKLNLLRRSDRRLVQTVTESAHNATHFHFSVRQKHHIDHHVAFQLQRAPFR